MNIFDIKPSYKNLRIKLKKISEISNSEEKSYILLKELIYEILNENDIFFSNFKIIIFEKIKFLGNLKKIDDFEKIQQNDQILFSKNFKNFLKKETDDYFKTINPLSTKIIYLYSLALVDENAAFDIASRAVDSFSCFLKKILREFNHTPDQKIEKLRDLLMLDIRELIEIINYLRDGFQHFNNKEKIAEIIRKTIQFDEIENINHLMSCMTMYNKGYNEYCYSFFKDLLKKVKDYKNEKNIVVECCKFLFSTKLEENIELVKENISKLLKIYEIKDKERYGYVASFISKTGISNIFNKQKIFLEYDEEFVFYLQDLFFFDEKNKKKYRIFSGESILKMECISKEYKERISDIFLEWALDISLDEKTRSNCADVVMSYGPTVEIKAAGLRAIRALSEEKNKNQKSMFDDSQNAHNEAILAYSIAMIESLAHEMLKYTIDLPKTFEEIQEFVRNSTISNREKHFAKKSLYKISIDTSSISSFSLNLYQITCYIWIHISHMKEDDKNLGRQLFLNELTEMEGWCSSGHITRLINSISFNDDKMKITWEDQIKGNVVGRINAEVKKWSEKEQEDFNYGAGEKEGEEREFYLTKTLELLDKIYLELNDEFVMTGGYLNEKEFNEFYQKAAIIWNKNYILESKEKISEKLTNFEKNDFLKSLIFENK